MRSLVALVVAIAAVAAAVRVVEAGPQAQNSWDGVYAKVSPGTFDHIVRFAATR